MTWREILAVLASEKVYLIPGVQETVVKIENLDSSEALQTEVPILASDVLPNIQSQSPPQVLPEESSQSSVNSSYLLDTPQPKRKRVVTGKKKRKENIESVVQGILKLKNERLELKRQKLQLDREAFEENKKYKQEKLDVLKRIAAFLEEPS